MSILSTNRKLIKVGQDYSAGSGISIDDGVISVTGEFGKTYSAGDNVNIYEQDEQLYISSKDWTNDIANASANAYNEAVAQIPDPFDPSFISGQVDNKLDTTAFTTWQNGQYTTDLQTIEGQINNKLDESAFSQVSASFLTAINIPESATWNEVSQAYEQASGTYLTSVSIPESATWQDVSTTVQTNSAQWAEGGTGGDPEVNSFVYDNSATINEVNTSYQTNSGTFLTAAPADMATTGDVAELAQTISETYQTKGDYLVRSDSANFYPANNPSGFITGVDLSNYYTKDETSGKEELSNAFANVPTPDYEVESYIHNNSASIDGTSTVVQSNSSTWSDVTAYQSNSSTYLTAHQSLDGYATETLVEETSGAITSLIPTDYYPDTNPSGFISGVDLSPYQTIEGMTAYQPVGSYATTNELEQVSADITATIPSTAGLASESYVQTNSAVLTGMIDGKQDTLTFGYDEQDRINSINSSALAGGGDVPTGTMNVSGLEYNAVNEISAYNGSAIAQYGAEKQFIVHDDTLVHLSNSAQYALGVAIDNVARLMGVDETELLSSTANSAFTLTEPFSSFKQVKIKLRWWDKVPDNYYDVERFTTGKLSLSWTYFDNITDGGPLELAGASWTSNNGIDYNLEGGFARTFGITSTGMGHFTLTPYPLSIIGIGRQQ